ncbi:adenosylcobinamide-phosphate synthase CbiB [Aurantimonas sp. MSK8Z-1]|uniref:adenosylcobinamide-phosphate synthase CbiB n=1 Tax=Mangrovibrevibacter kandeliae TaxID=2968473 RepID=UPI00222EA36F|nr:adenosylcobinamide-phosphate synthase CbiB [Aurantimonas sp. MSK8Z-1]MCW4117144.1 adenosylcobinamide-phosphate synthase CbiB [Aurantimonas sp. MSK8Z-1]
MSAHVLALVLGTVLDRLIGDPDWLWRRVPHPVVWMGKVIDALDRRLNRPAWSARRRRLLGIVALGVLLVGAIAVGLLLQGLCERLARTGTVLEALVVAIFLAQKSLADHVGRVALALEAGGLPAGRRAVALIVGRDPEQLDEAGVSRAAIESLAENASDGVVAPWLWFLAAGLPGLLAYKTVNTADSMIGHLSDRHRDFGWASARFDDLLNWPAARLTVLLFAFAALTLKGRGVARRAITVAVQDGPRHRSPNAGWPEAAVAAVLGLALGGPRRYGALVVDAPLINPAGRREASPADIHAALGLLSRLGTVLIVLAALALALSLR